MEIVKTCELCLELIIKTEDFENFNCNEKQNLQILQNLEITVSKDAKICSNCVNVSRLTYNFKTSCLTNNHHLKTLIHSGINDKLILEEILVENSKNEFKNEKVCRFCLNFSEVNLLIEVNLQQDVVLKDMLERCLPEIDMKFVENPLICYICSKLLKKLYNFISQYEATKIFRNLDPKTDVLVNDNRSTLTVENNVENINESYVKEENCDGIENPELEIKSEDFDINEDIKDSINERKPVEEKDVKPKPRATINEKRLVCDICSYQTTFNSHLKQHYLVHKEPWEVNLFKCDYCAYATKWKRNLTVHTVRHKNPSELPNKEWKHPAKIYTTKISEEFTVKLLFFSDQNLKEVRQHNPVEGKDVKPKPRGTIKQKIFVCNICSHRSNSIARLKRHYLIHKEPSEVNLFKCDYCPFTTKWKSSLTPHTIRHKNPSKLRIFKCNDCPYETSRKQNLVGHVLVHKTLSQVKTYECKVCPFQTKSRIGLRVHKKHHGVKIYSCDKCNYKSKFKHCVTKHLQHHKESKQPAKSNQNLKEVRQYKCNECSYAATRNSNLIRHLMLHKDLSEREIYNCTECSFQALLKTTLRRHYKKNHSNLEVPFGELKTFQCNEGA